MRTLLVFSMFAASSAFQSVCNTSLRRYASSFALQASNKNAIGTKSERFWQARDDSWRPDVNDVERISWGKPAKKKGTGNRGMPHRLNQDERKLFDQARRKGFLEVAGSAWRSQRRDAPLLNTYRSLCDARKQAVIVLHKSSTGVDEVVVDISPLRLPKEFATVAENCVQRFDIPISGVIEPVDEEKDSEEGEDDAWATRPIYQLPPYFISWELPRSEAKSLGKKLAVMFETKEPKQARTRKPVGVKPGKNRRSGGYGIG